jgi:dimethylargininase
MLVALTRAVSPSLVDCELTHVSRTPISVEVAIAQHHAYERVLAEAGCTIIRADAAPDLPDAVFIEDTAVVFDEVAIVSRPGAPSRRAETAAVAEAVRPYRPLRPIGPPATIDGGDVLVVGREVFVGVSSRTNQAAVEQMRGILDARGYRVHAVAVAGCLHLKSAVTAVTGDTLLLNGDWVDRDQFAAFHLIDVDPAEPSAANVVRVGDLLIYPEAFPRTRERLARTGLPIRAVDVSELAKAEGAVTCCSLIFPAVATAAGAQLRR